MKLYQIFTLLFLVTLKYGFKSNFDKSDVQLGFGKRHALQIKKNFQLYFLTILSRSLAEMTILYYIVFN